MSRERIQDVVGRNLAALRDARKLTASEGNRAIAKAIGIGEGTVARAQKGETNLTVSKLDDFARHYRVEAWQLLVQGFDPDNPPMLATEAEIEAEVQRRIRERLESILPEIGGLRAPEETRPDGRSVALPFPDGPATSGKQSSGHAIAAARRKAKADKT